MESLTSLSEPRIEALDPDPTTATSITGNKLIPNKNKEEELTEMINIAAQLKRGISRQFSMGSLRRNLSRQFSRQSSLDPRRNNLRFSFGRQSSLDLLRLWLSACN
ncbi:hypothetical protein EV1_034035 [Malus domestica]